MAANFLKSAKAPLAVAVASVALAQFANAQVLEEVTVTAQKRAENLQDVPVSVAAVTGEKIANQGIQNLEQMSEFVPNFSVKQSPLGDQINIRGIQSGIQAGFEQSVGTFVDGVYRGRAVQSRYSFMDVGMVEVLRGPQGTLFGKNTVAGALNITSAAPTDEFEAKIKATHNPEFESDTVLGVINIPMGVVNSRLAVQQTTTDKGWVENIVDNKNYPIVDDKAARLSFDIDLGSTVIKTRHEAGEWHNNSLPFQIVRGTPSPAANNLYYGDTVGLDYRTQIGQLNILTGQQDAVLGLESPQEFYGDMQEHSVTLEHEFASGSVFTAIASYSDYAFDRKLDADFNAVAMARFDEKEDFDQNSLELRFASETGGTFEYVTGLYYQQANLKATGTSYFGVDTIAGSAIQSCAANTGATDLATAGMQSAINPNSGLAYTCYLAAAGYQTGMALDPATGMVSQGMIPGISRYAVLDQESETYAAFGQFTYNLSDATSLTVGLRYTEETKTADQGVNAALYTPGSTGMPAGCMMDPACAAYVGLAESLGEFNTHYFSDLERKEDDFTWSINLSHDLNDDVMVYASSATGAKAGGFNSFYMGGTAANRDDADFEGESVLTYELGSKMVLLDGRADLNVAVFHTTYEDLQASVFSGNTTYEVRNAAEATTSGVELDSRFMITENFLMNASLGWLDFEFDSFREQACTSEQFMAWRQANWNPMGTTANFIPVNLLTNAGCSAAGVNDLAGKTSAHTPELSASLGFQLFHGLAGMEMEYGIDFNYKDEHYVADDLDAASKVDEEIFVNASIRLTSGSESWSVALIGTNLTDVNTVSYVADVPLQTGAQYGLTVPPRSVALQAEYNF